MAKQLNIDMNIRANTSSAQTELKKLQQTLDQAINGAINNSGDMKITKEISQATQAAAKLKVALDSAMNPKTGNLDLSKFSEQLSKSKMSLKQYSAQLLNLGPAGEKAFMQMANAIASAEIPLRKTSGLLSGLWTTMKNTARWQLSSTALHAFMGAIQGAYGYAQDLNKSLNNIRIVTGQNVDQMAAFAEQANKAARTLSTSTTAYTDAALIYYQQGLGNEEVKERTESTIKLANVSRQSAEEVSSQMTAIWNNFDDGSHKLEYYADVITQLGASTASSSSEIAEGISKFAAVADTVGLSYDKAAASVATVVAETRQSADVVGTAFKTMFARIEGLNLGETLEDGVTLNKYSSALETVGVNILDSNKKLKDMDTILDELGNKWNSIDKSQQVALAQTVAGVRQYTQFIALMDNYDKIEANEDLAKNSEGTLQKQQETYAESWEAAQKRVKAAAQGIYQELLNDKFFIGFTNAIGGILEGLDKFIDTIGGLPGVLGVLGTIATTVFKDQIALSIDNAVHNLAKFTGVAQDQAKKAREEMKEQLVALSRPGDASGVQQAEHKLLIENVDLNDLLAEKKEKLLETDYEELKALTEITQKYGEYAVLAEKALETAEEEAATTRGALGNKWANQAVKKSESAADARLDATMVLDDVDSDIDNILNSDSMQIATQGIKEFQDVVNNNAVTDDAINGFEEILTTFKNQGEIIPSVSSQLDQALNSQKVAFEKNNKAQKEYADAQERVEKAQKRYNNIIKLGGRGTQSWSDALNELEEAQKNCEKAQKKAQTTGERLQKSQQKVKTAIKGLSKEQMAQIKVSNNAEQVADQIISKLLKEEAIYEDDIDIIRQYIKEKLGVVDAENAAAQANENYDDSLNKTKDAIKNASSNMMTSFGQGLTTTFQGISQLSMGLSSLGGMFDTLNNTDMSFGEKFLSVATSLGMAIPSLISGLSNLKEGFGTVKEGVISGVKAFAIHIGALTAEEAAEEGLTFAKIKSAISSQIQEKANNSQTTSIWAKVAAAIAEKFAMSELTVVVLLLLAAILLVVAAAVGLVAIFNAIQEASPEGQLKKAEENARALADAAEEAKNRAKELKEAFDSYHEIVDKLNSCAKGTQEWRDTLQEVNQQVLDLIEKYPDLAKYVTTNSDGVMEISEKGEEVLTKQTNDAAAAVMAASTQAHRNFREKQINVMKDKISGGTARKVETIASYSGTNSGTSSTQTTSTDVSAQVKTHIKDNIDKYADMSENEIKEDLSNYFSKGGIQGDLKPWLDAIKELTTAMKQDTESRKAETSAIVNNSLANNEVVQASNNKEDVVKASGQIYDAKIKEKEKDLKDWGRVGISQANSVNDEARKVWREYLEAAGMSGSSWKLTDTTGNDDNRAFVYTDESGEEKKKTLEEMKETRAAYLALKDLGQSAEKIAADFDKLSNSTNQTDQALQGFLANKDFESSTANEASGVTDFVTKDDEGNYNADSNKTKEYLTKKAKELGYDSLDDMAKKYGYENGEKYVEAFAKKAEDITEAWDDIDLENMGLNKTEGWAQNLSLSAAKSLSNNFKKIKLGPMGEAAAQEYIAAIGDTLEGLDATDQEAALNAISEIDWSDYDAFEKLSTTMASYGKTLDENDPKWIKFIADMRRANGAIPDFSKLQDDLTEISKILNNLNFGDVIDDEAYAKIIALHEGWDKFFTMQTDGTRKFIGNAEQMKQATQDSVREAKKAMADRKNIQDELKKDSSLSGINWGKQASDIRSNEIQGEDTEKISDKQIQVLNNANVRKALTAQGYSNEDVERIVKNYNDNVGKPGQEAENAKNAYANLIQSVQKFSDETINSQEQQEQLNEKLASTATNLSELQTLYDNAEISAEAYDKQLTVLAMSASSLAELQSLQIDGMITNEQGTQFGLNAEEYSRALLNLAGNYDNCTNEILEYQKALASGSTELVNETQAVLENAIAIGEMAEALDLETEKVEEQARELISANNLTEEQYDVASKVAVLNQSMNKGVKELVDNWADYKKVLQSSEKGTEDYADAALKTKEALAQLLGVTDKDFIPDDFLEIPGVMDLIDKAIKGDEKAINSLGVTMAEATIKAFEFKEGMKDINGVELTADSFDAYKNEVLEGITSLTDAIKNGTIQAGEDITSLMDGTGQSWAESLNEMAYITGMSVEEMNSLLNEMGVEADVTTKTKVMKTQVPIYETRQQVISEGNGGKDYTARTSSRIVDYWEADTAMEVAQINMGDKKGTPPTITYAGRDNVSSSALTPSSSKSDSSSSESSSDKKNTSAATHEHEINRYSNEENAVNGLTKQYERLNKAKDKAFGASKIFAMEQELKALKDLKKASKDYLDAIVGSGNGAKIAQELAQGGNLGSMIASGKIGGTAGADYRALFSGADASGKQIEYTARDSDGNEWLASSGFSLGTFNSMFGTNLSFSLDSYGNIQNKDSMLNLIQNLTNSENDAYSRVADPDADSTTEHNKRLAYLKAMKERIEQYGNTIDTFSDKIDEYLDRITEIQEKNAEIITAKLDQGVNLGQKTIQRLDRSLKILGDNIYKTAEGMSKWYDANFNEGVKANKKQADSAIAAIADAEARVKLYEKNPYDENAISPEQAAEIIDQAEGVLDSVIDDLLREVEEGKELFGNTLDYWNEKLNKVNTAIENNAKILSHFQNILNLLGKSADYKALGQILQGISDNAKKDYESKTRQFKDAQQIYNSAQLYLTQLERMGITGDALEQQKEVVAQALEDYQNKYDAMLSSAETYIESINNITQNNINRIFAEAEKNLSGKWGNLDALDSAMQRHQSVADQYLTKTNQIYETNKLLRQIQQDIDKTDSKIAKNKLKNFSLEIDALKQREKLSKSSLEIAKAQYEMLQAQIALEEAQNAKTAVRLQRDNEGNYGYIYTADQEQVNDAEQNYADKENEYYNTLYKIQEEAGQRSIELRKEFLAELNSLQEAFYVDGTISEEEYYKQLADLKDTYQALEQVNQEDFLEASTLLNDVAAQGQTETWINSFDDIITKHRLFNDESTVELDNYNANTQSTADELTNKITSCLQAANAERERVEQDTKMGNKDLQRSINEVTSSTKQLSDSVIKRGGLADSMNTAMNKALSLSAAFVKQYNNLQQLINKYSDAADEANKFYWKMVDLVNIQVAYNHAKSGAKHVEWGPNGVYANYGGNNSGGDSGGSSGGNVTSQPSQKIVAGTWVAKNDYDMIENDYVYHNRLYYHTGTKQSKYQKEVHSWKYMYNGYYFTTKYESYRCEKCGCLKEVRHESTNGTHTYYNVGMGWQREDWTKPTADNPKGFSYKTGGYTGVWPSSGKTGMYTGSWNGPDLEENGKLAFLHQKELVLNASDTENMLEAVKLIRQISQQIDLQAISQSSGFAATTAQFFGDREPLRQDITIHAEFPNAKDHNEIEEAFVNLANKASQYANRY